jgi:dihydroorotate dehydrogenase
MYSALRPLLFRLDPEKAHALTLQLLRLAGVLPPARLWLRALFEPPERPVRAFGLTFTNPVGLAAGYDKDGLAWRGLACLGFGHLELGTVTPRPQSGNPCPRLFRLVAEQALINRLGFPGRGAGFLARRLSCRAASAIGSGAERRLVIGVNLGKNSDTPLEAAADDYLSLLQTFAPLADYLAINVSSPNTVGLRRLQAKATLADLLRQLAVERQKQQAHLRRAVPLLVKLAPDLSDPELADALEVIQQAGMDGVIATNTTLSRDGLQTPLAMQSGGLSGAPLAARSTAVIRKISAWTGGKLPVIGVGGILGPTEAREKLAAGAVLLQVYTGLVYAGPGLVKRIVERL